MAYHPISPSSSYPYQYSADVIEGFVIKYARVVLFVARKLNMAPGELKFRMIKMFQHHNKRWQIFREYLKYIEKWNMYAELRGYSRSEFIKWSTSVKTLCEDDVIFN